MPYSLQCWIRIAAFRMGRKHDITFWNILMMWCSLYSQHEVMHHGHSHAHSHIHSAPGSISRLKGLKGLGHEIEFKYFYKNV